jgi:hypothetical protein
MDELASRAFLGAGYQGQGTINFTQVSAHFCLCLNQNSEQALYDLTCNDADFSCHPPLDSDVAHTINKYRIESLSLFASATTSTAIPWESGR